MRRRRWLAWTVGVALPVRAAHQRVQRADLGAAGWPVGRFALTDDQGRAFTQDNLRGRWTFVLLGGAQCAEACSEPLAALAGVRRRIAGTEALKTTQVVLVWPDSPDGEGAQRLRDDLRGYDDSFIGATGSAATLAQLADELGVDVASDAAPGSMVLVGPDGTVRVRYLPPFDVLLLTAHYLTTRSRR